MSRLVPVFPETQIKTSIFPRLSYKTEPVVAVRFFTIRMIKSPSFQVNDDDLSVKRVYILYRGMRAVKDVAADDDEFPVAVMESRDLAAGLILAYKLVTRVGKNDDFLPGSEKHAALGEIESD